MKEQLVSYLTTNTGALTVQDILLNFLTAGIIAAVIYLSYRLSHSGASYSARFNVSLVMLTLVTTLVMNVIGNNISLSLGMVGALSIIRFRTAIKDPRDTAYIFWCIAVGICCGVSEYLIAGIGSAVVFAFMVLFGFVHSNERYLIVLRGDSEAAEPTENRVAEKFGGKARLRVSSNDAGGFEQIYEVSEEMLRRVKKDGDLAAFFRSDERIHSVNIVCQNDEINH